jgi:hypothetical protein
VLVSNIAFTLRAPQNKCDQPKDPSIPSGQELQQFVSEHKFAVYAFVKR